MQCYTLSSSKSASGTDIENFIIFSNIKTLVHVPLIDITDALKDHRLKLNDPLLRSFGSSTKIIIQTDRWDFRSIAMIGLSTFKNAQHLSSMVKTRVQNL